MKLSLAPLKISIFFAIGNSEYIYEARLWNVVIIAAILGMIVGIIFGGVL